jgi:hypothetical protein
MSVFRRLTKKAAATAAVVDPSVHAHVVDSTFSTALCRFVLACSCGARFDTNYIDEALEWHELHVSLAPLNDQLAAAER